jgi:hypothetical protein
MSKSVSDLEADMRANAAGIRFADAAWVAEHYFGEPRSRGSHLIYKMPWPMDPRVNLQRTKDGKAKAYQIKQLIAAIDHLASLG